jgi:hypothetical protein
MVGESSEKDQPAGIKRGRKMQKLTAVDIGKEYFDSLKKSVMNGGDRGSNIRYSSN